MAIGRLSVGVGKKGKASPHAQYIAREGKYAKPTNHQEKLENTGHGNMPKWAEHDPNYFWQSADEHERKNGSTYREHVITLPRELNENQRHELIKDWITQEIGDKHAYQYAIHTPQALDGKEQPHCHLMFSERTRDGIKRDPEQYFKRYNSKNPDKGGAKKANIPKLANERKEDLKAMRDRWEKTCNAHLERAGHSERISMKSLKEQGIEREPTNLTMIQLKKPEIKQAYIAELDARGQAKQAITDVSKEINRPIRDVLIQQIIKVTNQQARERHQAEQAQLREREQAQAKARPEPTPQPPQAIKAPPVETLENRQNPHEQGSHEYLMAVHNHANQLQQREIAKIKLEIKAIKNKPPVEPVKSLFESKNTHQTNSTAYRRDLQSYEKTVESKERELNQKQRVSTAEYVRYEHHQAVRQQRPDLARESDKATAWDKETRRLQREIEQLNKPQEQDHTKGKDIDW